MFVCKTCNVSLIPIFHFARIQQRYDRRSSAKRLNIRAGSSRQTFRMENAFDSCAAPAGFDKVTRRNNKLATVEVSLTSIGPLRRKITFPASTLPLRASQRHTYRWHGPEIVSFVTQKLTKRRYNRVLCSRQTRLHASASVSRFQRNCARNIWR